MSLIHCTQNCLYQKDGYCTLESAVKDLKATPNDYCVDFTPYEPKAPSTPGQLKLGGYF